MMNVPETYDFLRTPCRELFAIPIPVGALNLCGRRQYVRNTVLLGYGYSLCEWMRSNFFCSAVHCTNHRSTGRIANYKRKG